MIREFGFNKIYIIDSLNDNEPQTGKNLFEDLIRRKTTTSDKLYSEFIKVSNKHELVKTFLEIEKLVFKGYGPFIHLEVHGSSKKNGLVLKSGELFKWEELSFFTRKINVATKNNLVISLATCYGAYFIEQIRLNDAAPFNGCVVSASKLTVDEVEVRFNSFFDTLLSSFDFDLAVKNLNEIAGLPYTYRFIVSETLFEEICEIFLKENFNPKHIKFRNWVNDLTRVFRQANEAYAVMSKHKVKEIVRQQILSKSDNFKDGIKKVFLLCD
jgi:hypothetical protein